MGLPFPPGALPRFTAEAVAKVAGDVTSHFVGSYWEAKAPLPDRLARELYSAVWFSTHLAPAVEWLRDRSTTRRWAPSEGEEWQILCHAKHYTAAHHILRLLLGALPGGARWRTTRQRVDAPRICISCSGPATRAWVTPDVGTPGVAWCSDCLGRWCQGDCWALLPTGAIPAYPLTEPELPL